MRQFENNYLQVPLQIRRIEGREKSRAIGIVDSIKQFIRIILTSKFGDYAYDSDFGCSIWEHEYDLIYDFEKWKKEIESSIKEALKENEKRLTDIRVSMQSFKKISSGDTRDRDGKSNLLKYKLSIEISAAFRLTKEPFYHTDQFYIGPMAFDKSY